MDPGINNKFTESAISDARKRKKFMEIAYYVIPFIPFIAVIIAIKMDYAVIPRIVLKKQIIFLTIKSMRIVS